MIPSVRTYKVFLNLLVVFCLVFASASWLFSLSEKEASVWYYEQGNKYYRQGKYKEAQEAFKKAIALKKQERQSTRIKPESAVREQKSSEYVIGEDDVLFVSVWQNNDLNQEVVVRPDGVISFPLAGDLKAAGLTIPQLTAKIVKKLKEYIREPVVSVSLRRMGGKRIFVLGEVASPGVYSMTGKKTVLQAITMAGGFTSNAVVNSVIVIQGGLSNPKGKRLNLNRTLTGKDGSPNVILNPDDIVFIPKKFVANINYLVNQILGPIVQGAYNTETYKDKRW